MTQNNNKIVGTKCRVKRNGFTLIELMVTISIFVILAIISAPYLISFPASSRLNAYAQTLSAQIQNARSEAVRTNKIVEVCALKLDATQEVSGCATDAWDFGVLLYTDKLTGTSAKYAKGDKISKASFAGQVKINAIDSNNNSVTQLAFLSNGREQSGLAVDFKLTDNASGLCRGVLMDSSGQTSICKKGDADCANICK